MKKENKFLIILIALLILILIVGLLATNKSDSKEDNKELVLSNNAQNILSNAEKERDSINENEQKSFQEIDASKYLEYYQGENKEIVLIGRPTCHYCQIAEPILSNLAYKYDLDIKYLNTDELNAEDTKKITESNEFFKNGLGTPILLIISNGEIIDVVDGLTDTAHYIDFFKKNEFIK